MTQKLLSGIVDPSVKLVSFPMVDVGEFPLRLPFPNEMNTGGFLIPTASGSAYSYSPIDLLVAGIDATFLNTTVYDLPDFFYQYRNLRSIYMVYIILKIDNTIRSMSLAEAKTQSVFNNRLLKVMKDNAPLTFKW